MLDGKRDRSGGGRRFSHLAMMGLLLLHGWALGQTRRLWISVATQICIWLPTAGA
jgi:hypothetical protein